jgi:phosphate uptake regulator
MKRKVIQLAGKTLVVSLPSAWAQSHGIRKGDEVEVEAGDSQLTISAGSMKQSRATEVRILDKGLFLRRLVDNPYRLGYDEVTFYYDNPETFDKIEKEVGNLMGFEIIKQGNNYCIVKNLSQGLTEGFENILNRLMMITTNMIEEIHEAVQNKDLEKIERIQKMEHTNNKFTHFCKRMINTRRFKDNHRLTQVYRTVCQFEEMGDDLKDLCIVLANKKNKVSRSTVELMQKMHNHLKEFYKIYNKYSVEKVVAFGKVEKLLEKTCLELLELGKDTLVLHYLGRVLSKTRHLTEDLSG